MPRMTEFQRRSLGKGGTICVSVLTGSAWTDGGRNGPQRMRAPTFAKLVADGFLVKTGTHRQTDYYEPSEVARQQMAHI